MLEGNAMWAKSGKARLQRESILGETIWPLTCWSIFCGVSNLVSSCFSCLFQDDMVMGMLTVKENIEFSASLRLPSGTSAQKRKERVEEIITDLGLSRCADTKVWKNIQFEWRAMLLNFTKFMLLNHLHPVTVVLLVHFFSVIFFYSSFFQSINFDLFYTDMS